MMEIGGYIELDRLDRRMLHDDGMKLNSGRNALEYAIRALKIKQICIPKFMCNSINSALERNGVQVEYYSIDYDFKPIGINDLKDKWIYLVNYYGQYTNDFICQFGEKVIVDNVQAYYQEPIEGLSTIYSCRKYFGVPDGGILYADASINNLEKDESRERMEHLLGRLETSGADYYKKYVGNEQIINELPLRKMSALTENLLRAVDYEKIKDARTNNFGFLNEKLARYNKLNLIVPDGAFMYPLYISNGENLRKALIEEKIYIPMLWPEVLDKCGVDEPEYDLARNIVPLPVDQRYCTKDMQYVVDVVLSNI